MAKLGESFERLIATIQQRIDPSSRVTHNEYLIDRLRQRRQFDVIIRGMFAGQAMLGVIECKDLHKRVGTPEIDAFHTKAQDINANFKIIASKSGFTTPAIDKARHYGIRLVSLLDPDILGSDFPIGDWWTVYIYRWNQITIQAYEPNNPDIHLNVPPESLLVKKLPVINWFRNHLLGVGHIDKEVGWVVNFQLAFDPPILVEIEALGKFLCSNINFHAERTCKEHERFVPITADALVDWHTGQATIPPGSTIATVGVPTDFRSWPERDKTKNRTPSMFPVIVEVHEIQFELTSNAPDMESL